MAINVNVNTDSVQTMNTDLLGDLALHCEAVIDQLDGDADAERIAELQSAVHVMDAELAERNGDVEPGAKLEKLAHGEDSRRLRADES